MNRMTLAGHPARDAGPPNLGALVRDNFHGMKRGTASVYGRERVLDGGLVLDGAMPMDYANAPSVTFGPCDTVFGPGRAGFGPRAVTETGMRAAASTGESTTGVTGLPAAATSRI